MSCGCGARKENPLMELDEAQLSEISKDFREWIQLTERGKKWLAELAAEIGVPLQLTLPFKESGSEDRSQPEGCCGGRHGAGGHASSPDR